MGSVIGTGTGTVNGLVLLLVLVLALVLDPLADGYHRPLLLPSSLPLKYTRSGTGPDEAPLITHINIVDSTTRHIYF